MAALPDPALHDVPGQRLGHVAPDERPATDHLVLLQARVPLPYLVRLLPTDFDPDIRAVSSQPF